MKKKALLRAFALLTLLLLPAQALLARVAEENVTCMVLKESTKPIFTPGQARFEGLSTHATVSIYTIDGKMLSSTRANEEGTVSIDLSTLPQGVYILRTPNQSYKIKK